MSLQEHRGGHEDLREALPKMVQGQVREELGHERSGPEHGDQASEGLFSRDSRHPSWERRQRVRAGDADDLQEWSSQVFLRKESTSSSGQLRPRRQRVRHRQLSLDHETKRA